MFDTTLTLISALSNSQGRKFIARTWQEHRATALIPPKPSRPNFGYRAGRATATAILSPARAILNATVKRP